MVIIFVMPRGFRDEEKEYYRRKLLNTGIEMFSLHGFKKVSLDEVVRKTGISKGSFYAFFKSKEVFFMETLEYLENDFRSKMKKVLADTELTPFERLKRYLRDSFEYMENNPLLANIQAGDIEAIMLNMPMGKMSSHMNNDMNFLFEYLAVNRENAVSGHALSRNAIRGLFKSIFFVFQHRKDIGSDEYHAGIDLLIDMICHYFFDTPPAD